MNTLKDFIARLGGRHNLVQLTNDAAKRLRVDNVGIPEDYVTFLEEVGFGDLGPIQLYSGPIHARDVYTMESKVLNAISLIGDDFQGFCFGFDKDDFYRLVEVDPRGNIDKSGEVTFLSLLQRFSSEL